MMELAIENSTVSIRFVQSCLAGEIVSQLLEGSYCLPFGKEGKALQQVINYRPIALTSSVSKLMEQMVNTRFMWTLEEQDILSPTQCGFWRGMHNGCPCNTGYRYKTCIFMQAALNGILFDREKVYETTWKRGTLNKIYEANLRGNLPLFIQNILSKRRMRVKIDDTLSKPYEQLEGVPQGSVLSCSCFGVAINRLSSCLPNYVQHTVYLDDFAMDLIYVD